ncbi:MAG: zinc-dependent alcohol dehydrogenase [Planctomycetota bacterium]
MESRYVEFTGPGEVAVETEEVSTENLGPWEVVLRNEASLVSPGTELARLHDVGGVGQYPSRPGYASVGCLVAAGEAVTDFEPGERIFYAGGHAEVQRFRHGQDHQWGRLYPVPAELAPEDAVFGCLAEIGNTAPTVTELDLNDTVAVFGLGLVGNLAAQLYGLMGARLIGLDPVSARCELARQTGIATALDVAPPEQVEAILELTEDGVDVAVDAVGHSAVIENCIAATRLFGQVILVGTPRAAHECNATPAWNRVHEKGLVVRGAHQWRFPAMPLREVKKTVPWAFGTMFELILSGELRVGPLRSHHVRPERAPDAYEGLRTDREHFCGVVFDWTE